MLRTRTYIYSIIIGTLIICSAVLGGLGLYYHWSDATWTNYWTVMSTTFAAVLAVLSIIFEIRTTNKGKFQESLRKVNEEGSQTLIDYQKYLDNPEETSITVQSENRKRLVALLYQIKDLNKQRESLLGSAEDPVKSQSRLLSTIISSPKFSCDLNYIKDNFGADLNPILELYRLKSEILGAWVLNEDTAKNVKYLVAFSSIDREILTIYKVKDPRPAEYTKNRVIFSPKSVEIYPLKKIKGKAKKIEEIDEMALSAGTLLRKWTAQNPVLYFNNWHKNDKDHSDLIKLINLIIKLKGDAPNEEFDGNEELDGKNDILIVKVNQPVNRNS